MTKSKTTIQGRDINKSIINFIAFYSEHTQTEVGMLANWTIEPLQNTCNKV